MKLTKLFKNLLCAFAAVSLALFTVSCDDAADKAGDAAGDAADAVGDAAEKGADAVGDAADKGADAVKDAVAPKE